jgi:hypothetical protein
MTAAEPFAAYDFFIFERSGKPLYYKSFSKDEVEGAEERGKLVYGVLFSLKQMIPSLSPADQIVEEGIRSLSTKAFTLHSFESPTGYRFALVTAVATPQLQVEARAALEKIFAEVFVDLVMLDPSYKPGSKIDSPNFTKAAAAVLQRIGS